MIGQRTRRIVPTGELSITSMMDMFTIILVFLLMSFSTTDAQITPNARLVLPTSQSPGPVEVAVALVVQRDQVLVDGLPVFALLGGGAQGPIALPAEELEGAGLPALEAVLRRKAEAARQAADADPKRPFAGQLLLQVDKDVPFSVVRPVLFSAGEAGFGQLRFVTYRGGPG